MSLQVWLPLDGNLENKGLSDISVSGSITYTDGKIGKCLSAGRIDITNTTLPVDLTANNVYSAAYWLKINTLKSAWLWYFGSGSGTTRGQYLTTSGAVHWAYSGTGQNIGSDTTLADLNWHHVTITSNGAIVTLYIDGTNKGSITANKTDQLTSNSFVINASNNIEAYLNDFRIYDHCLSQKEVKELSKGLIGHWPLNDMVGGENLLSVTPRTHTATAYNAYQFNLSENLVAGQTYTIQLWDVNVSHASKSAADLGVDVYWGGGSVRLYWWHGTSYFTNGHADHLQATFTVTEANASGSGATNAWLNIYNSVGYVAADMSMTIGKWKLEKGSIATPWIPAPSDSLYSAMGLDDGLIYDTSGYGRNGTITGSLIADSDTPRYNVCDYFDGSSYIKTLPGEFSWTNFDTLTIAAWMKPTTTPSAWTGSIGIAHDANSSNKCFSISNYGGKFTVHTVDGGWVNTQSSYTMPLNVWHHYVATLDGTTVKMYVDGDLVHTETIDWKTTTLHANPQIQIGVDLPGGDERYTGYYSDVRIYATALSQDDIKELYETAASVDNHGNFHAYELNEL